MANVVIIYYISHFMVLHYRGGIRMRFASMLGTIIGALFAAAIVTLIVGGIIHLILKAKRNALLLPPHPGDTKALWKADFSSTAASLNIAKYFVCAFVLLIYVFAIFGPNILLNIFVNVIIAGIWWTFTYLADYYAIKVVKEIAPVDLNFAINVGKKCPGMQDLLKSLNPEFSNDLLFRDDVNKGQTI